MAESTGITITLGKTSKKINSTSQTISGTNYTGCFLKENCDIHDPVIILNAPYNNYNYMVWDGRYYWVDKVISLDWKRIEIHTHLDPFATFKGSIQGLNVYASFANASNWNKEMDDPRMSPEKEVTPASPHSNNLFGFTMTPHNGSVVITVLESAPHTSHQGFKIYAMSVSSFRSMLTDLTSVFDNITSLSQTIDDLAEILGKIWGTIGGTGSWADNLLKAVYVPIDISDMPGSAVSEIALGAIVKSVSAKSITPGYIQTHTGSLNVNWTANATNYPFLKYSRFTQFQVICCGGSFTAIDSALLRIGNNEIYFDSAIDVCSGAWVAVVTEGAGTYNTTHLASFAGCCGIDITGTTKVHDSPLMQSWEAGFGTSAKIMSGGLLDFEKGSSASIISGIAGEFIPTNPGNVQSGSVGGSIASMFLGGSSNLGKISICQTCFEPDDIANYENFCDRYGYPANKYISLSGYSGYVKCVNASCGASGATAQDKQMINACLNSGIYIE